jgi:competence protein ComEC
VTLDRTFIYGEPPERTPRRLRVTLEADAPPPPLGARVSVMARIGPPGGPVEPGGFDFRRAAFFDRLGGIGLARGPLALIPPEAPPGPLEAVALALDAARAAIAAGLRARMPGEAGAFAAAIAVGDRAALPREAVEALRAASLAHLLAISGLHMAIACGLAFVGLRLALVLVPGWGVRWPVKKIAAGAAILAGLAYLALSGGSVATQRAFVMAAVAFGAILVDRPAVTMRGLALAAALVLALRPESLVEAGFQMSFAAALALVAAYEAARPRLAPAGGTARRLGRYALGLLATSALAGLATAPFAAAIFGRLAVYGLLANLAAVPVMGFVAAPGLAAAALLAPLGLEAPALAMAEAGIGWILAVARFVAGLEGAVTAAPAPPRAAMWLIVGGGLWLALTRGPLRLAGLAPLGLALAMWSAGAPRPAVLVAPGGGLIGVVGEGGRAVTRARGEGYAAETWLRRDGDLATQETAAARPALARDGPWLDPGPGAPPVAVYLGEAARPSRLAERCRAGALVLAPRAALEADGPCLRLDAPALADRGALAIEWRDGAPRLREDRSARLWRR